jgi:hypothetical protein
MRAALSWSPGAQPSRAAGRAKSIFGAQIILDRSTAIADNFARYCRELSGLSTDQKIFPAVKEYFRRP